MKIFGHNIMESIFSKLILTFLLVMVPIYIIGAVIYNVGFKSVKDGITRYYEYKMDFYVNNLEKDLQRIRTLQFDCFEDTNLLKLANLSENQNYYNITEAIQLLQQRLYTIKNSSNYIEDVEVHVLKLNKIISVLNGVDELSINEYSKLKKINYSSNNLIKYVDEEIALLGFNPRPRNSTNDPTFIFKINLSKNELEKSLIGFNSLEQGGSTFIIDNENEKIISKTKDLIPFELKKLIEQKKILKTDKGSFNLKKGKTRYYIFYLNSNYLDVTLFKCIPYSELLTEMKAYEIWFWAFTLATILIIILYAIYMRKFIHNPLLVLVEAFKKLEKGDLNISIKHIHVNEFKYLFSTFNNMAEKLCQLIEQVYKQKIMTQRAELKQLQAQINPHFLFNSFFILQRKIKIGDLDNAVIFCEYLGCYFQFITRSSNEDVTLSMEYEHAKVYGNIQAMRFLNRIQVHFDDLPEDLKTITVPRLIIQPIIENAFMYGLEDMSENGILNIKFDRSEQLVKIIIEDNGKGMEIEEMEILNKKLTESNEKIETTGVINIHRRLQLFFGMNSGLVVSKSTMGGFRVTLSMNLKEVK